MDRRRRCSFKNSNGCTGSFGRFEASDTFSFRTSRRLISQILGTPILETCWVIQELALAKRTTIHCGGRQTSWTQLASTLKSLSSTKTVSYPAVANANNLVQFHEDALEVKPLRFIEALRRNSEALSSDPRDKVFALLGLVYDGSLYLPVPNYRQSVDDICMGMLLSAIDTTSPLDIVPFLGRGYCQVVKQRF